MEGILSFAALCAVLGFFLPLMPGRVAAIISLVFMVFSALVCAMGAYVFWAGSYYGDEGWDPLLLLPTVYFALVVVTLVGLFVTRHSRSSWRIGIGGVAVAALMGILPLLTIVVLFSGSS
ncbi:MAG: hypothetical protein OXH12_10440 [Chloroflexi bacterium]|nr:hypothetical protein [Chloroflexota bacterium]